MRRTALLALLSHWRARPLQLLTLVLGLALATALWSGVQAMNAEARASYDRAATVIGSARPSLTSPGAPFDEAEHVALRRNLLHSSTVQMTAATKSATMLRDNTPALGQSDKTDQIVLASPHPEAPRRAA
ncbi:MAG: hypothetical protein AAGA87_14380 [Pseudomonadota bacterium]